MSISTDSFVIVSRFLVPGEGWRTVETTVGSVTFQAAGREASRLAKELDAQHGDSHFWTVDLYNENRRDLGSYYQLFHGRLA